MRYLTASSTILLISDLQERFVKLNTFQLKKNDRNRCLSCRLVMTRDKYVNSVVLIVVCVSITLISILTSSFFLVQHRA